jgi:hypothetical protein
MQQLSDGLAQQLTINGNNKVKMLFAEWRTLYGQVADLSIVQAEAIVRELKFTWSGSQKIQSLLGSCSSYLQLNDDQTAGG